jgi:hypothetical protein
MQSLDLKINQNWTQKWHECEKGDYLHGTTESGAGKKERVMRR